VVVRPLVTVCWHLFVYAHISVLHVYVYINVHMHAIVYVCIFLTGCAAPRWWASTFVFMYINMYIHVDKSTFVSRYIRTYMFTRIYKRVDMYTYMSA